MTLADKLISLNSSLATIDALLLDCESPVDIKIYYKLQSELQSVYQALSNEWLEQNNPKS